MSDDITPGSADYYHRQMRALSEEEMHLLATKQAEGMRALSMQEISESQEEGMANQAYCFPSMQERIEYQGNIGAANQLSNFPPQTHFEREDDSSNAAPLIWAVLIIALGALYEVWKYIYG